MKDTCIGCGSEQIVKRTNVSPTGRTVTGYHCIQCGCELNRWVGGGISVRFPVVHDRNVTHGIYICCPSGAVFIFGEEPA